MPKNKYESRYVMNKNITDMKAAIKNTVREVDSVDLPLHSTVRVLLMASY